MQSADLWQPHCSEVTVDIMRSMIIELVRHHESRLTGNEKSADWQSPTRRTRIIKYSSSACLFNILNQEPDAIAAEYQLHYLDTLIYSWQEYRWPYLHATQKAHTETIRPLPADCIDELMLYHLHANTTWLNCYRNSLSRDRVSQINEVGIVAEPDCVSAL